MEQERRISTDKPDVRAAEDGPRLVGYAARFNAETVIAGSFRERIAPGAFTDAVSHDDVRALFNHDPSRILGRTKSGTLALREDDQGLRYEVLINASDPEAVSVLAKVQRGDVDGSSFAFAVEQSTDEEWDYSDRAKLPLRTIKRATLYDVSPVVYPAYDATSVSARARTAAAVTVEPEPQAAKPDGYPVASGELDLIEMA